MSVVVFKDGATILRWLCRMRPHGVQGIITGEYLFKKSHVSCEIFMVFGGSKAIYSSRTTSHTSNSSLVGKQVKQNFLWGGRPRPPAHMKFKGMTLDVQKDIERITNIWRQLREQFSKQGNMLFGKFTIADAMYAPVILRFKTYGVQLNSICQDYSKAVLELPAMQQWLEAAKNEQETIPAFELGDNRPQPI